MCGDKEKKMTREFFGQQIGLSSSKGVDIVSDCTSVLASSGFINKRKEYNYGNDVKCDVYYSVNSHDKWLEIKNRNWFWLWVNLFTHINVSIYYYLFIIIYLFSTP